MRTLQHVSLKVVLASFNGPIVHMLKVIDSCDKIYLAMISLAKLRTFAATGRMQ